MFAPTAEEIRNYVERIDPHSPYVELAEYCDQTPAIVWQHLRKLCDYLIRQTRSVEPPDERVTNALILLSSTITPFMENEKEYATSVERRRIRDNHDMIKSKPLLYVREFVWFVIAQVRCALHVNPRPPLDERRIWFSNHVSKILLPSRWWDYLCTATPEEEYKRNQIASAYCADLINPIVNPSGGLWDPVILRTIAICERVFRGYQFCHTFIPISSYPPIDDNPVHPHAAGRFVKPRFANDPSKRRAIRDRIDEYIRNSQHTLIGRQVSELGTARHVMFGEYAAYERESPHDARVFKARTTLKRCMYTDKYRDDILALAVSAESESLSLPKFAKWKDTIDLCVYSMMFTEMVPPIQKATSGAGRTGVSTYIDAFRSEYVISWYDWMSVPHMQRMLFTKRDDRAALPMIIDIGKGFLVRDGPANSMCTMLVSGTSLVPPPDHRHNSRDTEWVYLPTAMDALIEWEYRAQEYHEGTLERIVPIPKIARCDADVPRGDDMMDGAPMVEPEPDFVLGEPE